MFRILILAAAYVVLVIIVVALRLVLKERAGQRVQRERAAIYFATRAERHVQQEAALHEAVRGAIHQRAP
jgi:hypothetical protein